MRKNACSIFLLTDILCIELKVHNKISYFRTTDGLRSCKKGYSTNWSCARSYLWQMDYVEIQEGVLDRRPLLIQWCEHMANLPFYFDVKSQGTVVTLTMPLAPNNHLRQHRMPEMTILTHIKSHYDKSQASAFSYYHNDDYMHMTAGVAWWNWHINNIQGPLKTRNILISPLDRDINWRDIDICGFDRDTHGLDIWLTDEMSHANYIDCPINNTCRCFTSVRCPSILI